MNRTANKSQETHNSLREALVAWAPVSNNPELRSEIISVIDRLKKELGPVVRVYIPKRQRQYVAVIFRDEPEQVGAYIARRRIDHIAKLTGSTQSHSKPRYWRTRLVS